MRAQGATFTACLVLVSGCAITDYGLITDNDQAKPVREAGHIVNTNGKAHFFKDQWVTIWPDGTDELIHFVDQKANGDRTLTTYNNFSTFDEPAFSSNLYCNSDWSGCAIFTAPDPQEGDDDQFDGRLNPNCAGARSLSILLSTGRYYGECGRGRALSLDDRLALLAASRVGTMYGREGLVFDWSGADLSVRLTNERGQSYVLPISGDGTLWTDARNRRSRFVLDATHSLLAETLNRYASWLDHHATDRTELEVCYNGVCRRFTVAGNRPPVSTGARVRANRLRHY